MEHSAAETDGWLSVKAWPALIHSQQAILAATEFVILRNKTVKANGDMGPISRKMRELETYIGPLVEESEKWTLGGSLTTQVDTEEHILARSLKAMARIKLNRYVEPTFPAPMHVFKSDASTQRSDQDTQVLCLL